MNSEQPVPESSAHFSTGTDTRQVVKRFLHRLTRERGAETSNRRWQRRSWSGSRTYAQETTACPLRPSGRSAAPFNPSETNRASPSSPLTTRPNRPFEARRIPKTGRWSLTSCPSDSISKPFPGLKNPSRPDAVSNRCAAPRASVQLCFGQTRWRLSRR